MTRRSTDALVREGLRADFALTGEPTDLHIGVQAKGVLAVRLRVAGTAAHGSTPWLGDNAILKAHDAYRRIETLPFSRESSDLFDRPSINLARIDGGDAFNKVPDTCTIDVDIRFLPGQRPDAILDQIRRIGDIEVVKTFIRAPAIVARDNPYVLALRDAVGRSTRGRRAERRPRRRVRRDPLPGGRHPGGRVRARRRRPPRPARVGLGRLAGALPHGAGRLRPGPAPAPGGRAGPRRRCAPSRAGCG